MVKKSKTKKSTKVVKSDEPINRGLTDMRKFHSHTDWVALWEDFYLGLNPDGSKKWKTLYSFICALAESPLQKEFLLWYLGPKNDTEEKEREDIKYSWTAPQDWTKRRNEGGWFTSGNLKAVTMEIRRRTSVLEVMEEVGRTVTLNSVARAEQLAQRIDKYFKGEPCLEGLSLLQNEKRAGLYIKLQTQVLGLAERTFALFAKSHGVDFNDLSSLVQFYQVAALSQNRTQSSIPEKSRTETAVEALVNMTMQKAAKYRMTLPEVVETTIVEAVEAREDTPAAKKRKVQ